MAVRAGTMRGQAAVWPQANWGTAPAVRRDQAGCASARRLLLPLPRGAQRAHFCTRAHDHCPHPALFSSSQSHPRGRSQASFVTRWQRVWEQCKLSRLGVRRGRVHINATAGRAQLRVPANLAHSVRACLQQYAAGAGSTRVGRGAGWVLHQCATGGGRRSPPHTAHHTRRHRPLAWLCLGAQPRAKHRHTGRGGGVCF